MLRTMVVDDERIVRQGIMSLTDWTLFNIQFVAEAKDGVHALALLEEHSIDLMFVDITMPNMNGIELIRRVQLQYPKIKFIIVTCHHEFDYVKEALQLGALDYIVKTLLDKENVVETMTRIQSRLEREHISAPYDEGMTYEGGIYYISPINSTNDDKNVLMRQHKIELKEISKGIHQAKLMTPASIKRHLFVPGSISGCWLSLPAMKSVTEAQVQQWLKRSSHTYIMYSSSIALHVIKESQLLSLVTEEKQLYGGDAEWSLETEQYKWLVYSQYFIKWLTLTEHTKPDANTLLGYIKQLYSHVVMYMDWNEDIKKELQVEELLYWEQVYGWCQRFSLYIRSTMDEREITSEVAICLIKAILYMKQRLHEDIKQEEVAFRVGMSRSYFSLCYKRFFGHSFGEVLRCMRIEEAKTMLLTAEFSIAEIAQHVGFEDTKYFSRTFKQYVHVYPSAYRSLHVEVNNK